MNLNIILLSSEVVYMENCPKYHTQTHAHHRISNPNVFLSHLSKEDYVINCLFLFRIWVSLFFRLFSDIWPKKMKIEKKVEKTYIPRMYFSSSNVFIWYNKFVVFITSSAHQHHHLILFIVVVVAIIIVFICSTRKKI